MSRTTLIHRLAVLTATGALAGGLAAPAQADPPADRSTATPAPASVRPDDRANRSWPNSPPETVLAEDDGGAFESADALGVAIVLTAIGLGIAAMVYSHRLGSA